MTVTESLEDREALTLTFVTEFDASVERVWQVWEDPRQLERWWGPPTWPATFERHELHAGGGASYYMTGPDGEKARGWWEVTAVDAPHRLEFDDGFSTPEGERDTSIDPTHAVITLDAIGTRTRMTLRTQFTSIEQLGQMIEMGMQEGMQQALGQLDELLTEVRA